jgi:hypothetical protein
MNKTLRWIAVLAVWAAAAAALLPACVEPYRCNVLELEVQQRTVELAKLAASPIFISTNARRNLDRIRGCLHGSVNRYMLAASNARLLHDYSGAVALLREATRYDHRPELYLNLGLAETEAGYDKEGLQHLITACLYNPEMLDEIQKYHTEAQVAIWNYQLRMLEKQKRTSR